MLEYDLSAGALIQRSRFIPMISHFNIHYPYHLLPPPFFIGTKCPKQHLNSSKGRTNPWQRVSSKCNSSNSRKKSFSPMVPKICSHLVGLEPFFKDTTKTKTFTTWDLHLFIIVFRYFGCEYITKWWPRFCPELLMSRYCPSLASQCTFEALVQIEQQ